MVKSQLRAAKQLRLSDLEQLKIDKDFVTSKVKLPYTPPLLSPQNGQIFDFLSDQGLDP